MSALPMLCMLLLICPAVLHAAGAATGIPLTFDLPQAGYVTLVIEDNAGRRVRNLVGQTYLDAGEHTLYWDGLDLGERNEKKHLVQHRIAPGAYRLRGLVHDGIQMIYEFSVYSPGDPPWFTTDHTGAWLADHTPPADVLFLPAGSGSPYGDDQDQLLLCSNVAESGYALVWVDESGHKLFSTKISGWMGGKALARDDGPGPVDDFYAYTIFLSKSNSDIGERAGENGAICLYGLTPQGKLVPICNYEPETCVPFDAYKSPIAFDVHNGMAVISNIQGNNLLFVDVAKKTLIGKLGYDSPRGVAFDEAGRLYVATGDHVNRHTVQAGEARLVDTTRLIKSGLSQAQQIHIDHPTGDIYVSDWSDDHQVKVFSNDGRLQRIVGRPGGPQLGEYDPLRMHHPRGMTVDSKGRLWVAEDDFLPKRVSVWDDRGNLVNAFYGPPQYGGGGAIDPNDRSRFYYASSFNYGSAGGLAFELDWQTGRSKLTHVYHRDPEPTGRHGYYWQDVDMTAPQVMACDALMGAPPQFACHIDGRHYMINTFNGWERKNAGGGIWLMDDQGVAWPVAAVGCLDWIMMPHLGWTGLIRDIDDIQAKFKDEPFRQMIFAWSDINFDHYIQPDEIEATYLTDDQGNRFGLLDGHVCYVDTDLSVATPYGGSLPAPEIDDNGIPHYDLDQFSFQARCTELGHPFQADDWYINFGWVWATRGNVFSGYRNGQEMWQYHVQVGEHTPVAAIMPEYRGMFDDPTKYLGPAITPNDGEAGPVIAVNNDLGAIYLMTVDGLLIQSLGGDSRVTPLWRHDKAERGMVIENISFGSELFHPTINKTSDGEIYLIPGHEHTSILRLDGFDSLKRLDFGSFNVSSEMLEGISETVVDTGDKHEVKELKVAILSEPLTVDGDLSDWSLNESQWAKIDAMASASICVSDHMLYAAYRTGNPNHLVNAGVEYPFFFVTGATLELMLGTDPSAQQPRHEPVEGDLRLLVTRVDGRDRAVLYRPVAPGTPENQHVRFSSPVGMVDFDQVIDVSDYLTLEQRGGDFELAIPLEVLALQPRSNTVITGDIGILRGNGAESTQRIYWNNRYTSSVCDIPTESRLQPANWGLFRFADER